MDQVLRKRGMEARRKAQKQAAGARIDSVAWYPQITWLKDLGYTNNDISEAIQLDVSGIRRILREGHTNQKEIVKRFKAPVDLSSLDPHFQSMLDFSAQAFASFFSEFSGTPLPAHCEDWVQEFIDHRNLMLNVPPRHMKSTIFSLWVPIWLLARNRDEQIILVSKTRDLAIRWASDIANQLEFNPHLVDVFGRFAPERSGDSPWRPGSGQLLVLGRQRETRGMQLSILARGSGQQILGMEATVVIVDDATDARVARSDTERERELDWLRGEVLSRIENPIRGGAAGRAVIIGQRVAFKDLYGQIAGQTYERGPKLGERLWTVIEHPAVSRWPNENPDHPEPEVLWPEQWPFEELMVQYERVGGHRVFETMFQQNPLPDDAKLVRPEWWVACRDVNRAGGIGTRIEAGDKSYMAISRVISLDPSPRKFNGIIVADVIYDRERFICSVIEAVHFIGSLHDILGTLRGMIDRYGPDYLVIEFSTFAHWMQEDPVYRELEKRVRILPHSTGRNKADPELGVESLAGDIELGNVHLPYGDDWGRAMSTAFEEEANVWPFGDHDDILMALWFIKYNWRKFVPPLAYRGHFTGAKAESWGYMQKERKSIFGRRGRT